LLKLYIYGYLSRVQSSRRLEREAGRNVGVMWLTGRLVPDHKTIADFRKDNGRAIRQVCARFVALCRRMGLFAEASVAIDGSKFKAVNNRDRNFTRAKMQRRMEQIEESVARYLQPCDFPMLGEKPRQLTALQEHSSHRGDVPSLGQPRLAQAGEERLATGRVLDARFIVQALLSQRHIRNNGEQALDPLVAFVRVPLERADGDFQAQRRQIARQRT